LKKFLQRQEINKSEMNQMQLYVFASFRNEEEQDEAALTENFRSTLQNQFTATAENINFCLPLTIETFNKQIENLTNDKKKIP
jgi:hypothetical protein